MGVNFTPQESCVLYGMLADHSADIILKTDRDGYVQHASPAIARLGFTPQAMLIGPHLTDLIDPADAPRVQRELDAALQGDPTGRWIECRAASYGPAESWFELQTRSIADRRNEPYGAIGIMRSIAERKTLEERLFAASMTDPLTGLSNRRAFIAMLQYLVDSGARACVALFDIDYFRAINLQFGQSVGDRVLVVFAEMLRAMMRPSDIISRVGGESIGVLLLDTTPEESRIACRRIVATLADLYADERSAGFAITASASIAEVARSLDDTLKRAELALFMAKAKGRNRLEMDGGTGLAA